MGVNVFKGVHFEKGEYIHNGTKEINGTIVKLCEKNFIGSFTCLR